jgi:2-polyprenyl-6-methoxyphenol hydroxylase-like FAD-dependent oxidoreductase
MGTSEHAVAIAGGGPARMMLGAELALAGVDVVVVERRPEHVLAESRAGGLNSRTVEVFDQHGIADRFLEQGHVHPVVMFGGSVLDMSDFPTRHPYTLGIWQNEIERIMAEWIAELPVHIHYGREVTGSGRAPAPGRSHAGPRRCRLGAPRARPGRRPPPPWWSAQTATPPGSETEPTPGSPTR